MNQKALTAAAIVGVAIGVLSGIPVLNFVVICTCCLPVIGSGLAAVWLYMRNSGATSVTTQEGLMMGLVSGGIGGLVSSVLSLLTNLVMADAAGNAAAIEQALASMPPEQAEQMRPLVEALANGGGGVLGVCVGVVLFAVLGLIGGVIGAATIGKPKQLTTTGM
jgi:hypothetical protein